MSDEPEDLPADAVAAFKRFSAALAQAMKDCKPAQETLERLG
jgi:hypothetical protein